MGFLFRRKGDCLSPPAKRAAGSGDPTAVNGSDLSSSGGRDILLKPPEDYHLLVSELVPCGGRDSGSAVLETVEVARRGEGLEYRTLKNMARPNVEFCGRVSSVEIRDLYARCRAFIMPGEEDFGIAAVEALASGKPVIALGRGGVLERAPQTDRLTGLLYP
jgi:glycosyltransferase involved in cell wall biosynthesis